MFSPSYTITHHILNYIVRYELSLQKIKNTPLPDTYYRELDDKIQAENISSIGELISYPLGFSKALEIQRGKIIPSAKVRIFTNFRSTNDFINAYSSTAFIKPSIELSVHINKLLLKRIVEEWEGGKLRTFSEKPNEIYDTWYSLRDFYPDLKPKRHFDSVYSWIVDSKISIHKLIQISILLYEYIDKAPFAQLNQATAIQTIAVMLKEYNLNYKNIIPVAKSLDKLGGDLANAFKMSKSKRDMTIFIEAFLYTLSLTALDVENQVTNIYRNRVKKYSKLNEMFNPRQIKILEYLEVEKKITRREYAKMMGITFMTAFRDLQELLGANYIVQQGNGRSTNYILPTAVEEKEVKEDKPVFISN